MLPAHARVPAHARAAGRALRRRLLRQPRDLRLDKAAPQAPAVTAQRPAKWPCWMRFKRGQLLGIKYYYHIVRQLCVVSVHCAGRGSDVLELQ